jgi:hypothetical protein
MMECHRLYHEAWCFAIGHENMVGGAAAAPAVLVGQCKVNRPYVTEQPSWANHLPAGANNMTMPAARAARRGCNKASAGLLLVLLLLLLVLQRLLGAASHLVTDSLLQQGNGKRYGVRRGCEDHRA